MSDKAEIARSNGAKSNGPVTDEGKAISSQNSLRHGLTSARVVLPHESQEEFDRLEASFVNRFKPYDEIEFELVHEMAAARWRLRRIEAMEVALFNKAFKHQRELLGPRPNRRMSRMPPMPKSPSRSLSACSRGIKASSAAPTRRPGKSCSSSRNIEARRRKTRILLIYKTNPESV